MQTKHNFTFCLFVDITCKRFEGTKAISSPYQVQVKIKNVQIVWLFI
jgi:hypothetical protein